MGVVVVVVLLLLVVDVVVVVVVVFVVVIAVVVVVVVVASAEFACRATRGQSFLFEGTLATSCFFLVLGLSAIAPSLLSLVFVGRRGTPRGSDDLCDKPSIG